MESFKSVDRREDIFEFYRIIGKSSSYLSQFDKYVVNITESKFGTLLP